MVSLSSAPRDGSKNLFLGLSLFLYKLRQTDQTIMHKFFNYCGTSPASQPLTIQWRHTVLHSENAAGVCWQTAEHAADLQHRYARMHTHHVT